jgi:hypothetical protein
VPASSLPCGDIDPTVGITGTPVIDTTRQELFVVADRLRSRQLLAFQDLPKPPALDVPEVTDDSGAGGQRRSHQLPGGLGFIEAIDLHHDGLALDVQPFGQHLPLFPVWGGVATRVRGVLGVGHCHGIISLPHDLPLWFGLAGPR